MLQLRDISKIYRSVSGDVPALRGVSITFRESEFVSVLGQSGCGKTTLLNIIGGLDHYTYGDLIISGRSTREFRESDWDAYRNHSIGFIFQSYNLIPHQTVLSNVELALTLSGVSRAERRERAIRALEKVGLGDQLKKKPNQMSGGQMQRVAIARALVNDPEILLADEPTGALDSVTSVQIMDLLKEIAQDRLVIMVTHNPELAEQYSTRIIRLLDGRVVGDSNPCTPEEEAAAAAVPVESRAEQKKRRDPKTRRTSMSFFTALALSFNNLMTKKGRTFLTSFAGSIGIIGIALILSVSAGVNAYITSVEQSTMASYPLSIQESTMDTATLLSALMGSNQTDGEREDGRIYSNDVMVSMMQAMSAGMTTNDMAALRRYIQESGRFDKYVTDVKYIYKADLNTYSITYDESGNAIYKENLRDFSDLMQAIGVTTGAVGGTTSSMTSLLSGSTSSALAWSELIGDRAYLSSQYDLVDGRLPENKYEVVLMVDKDREVSDYILYMLGIRDTAELKQFVKESQAAAAEGRENTYKIPPASYTYADIYAHTFKALPEADKYSVQAGLIKDATADELYARQTTAPELRIVGILAPSDDNTAASGIGAIGYRSDLMPELIRRNNESDVVKLQQKNPDKDMFTGYPFAEYTLEDAPALRAMMAAMGMPAETLAGLSDEQIVAIANNMRDDATYAGNLEKLGYVDTEKPSSILIYPKDFEAKDNITRLLNEYNNAQTDESKKITYTDTVALLMSSVTTIVNAISYVLIAFVAISLVVSSIMIGIITYISVLERTKEIGILRAIGASRGNVSNVFNAETLTVGFGAGLIGILVTLLLNVIINIILHALTGIPTLNAVLPFGAAVILVGISMFLTFIAGLIPSGMAARKDPVVALRTE